MSYERIDESPEFDGPVRDSHETRYHIASGFVSPGDDVLDACCGVGYGKAILERTGAKWHGIDRNPANPETAKYDFETRQAYKDPDRLHPIEQVIDVFVGMECIEHFNDEGVAHFIEVAKKASKWIIVSTPIVPNNNPHHKQQFTEEQMVEMFVDTRWRHFATLYQTRKYGIFIFKKVL